jgi:hypothetical protein
VWENVENHRASILEKIQVKTALEQLEIREERGVGEHKCYHHSSDFVYGLGENTEAPERH